MIIETDAWWFITEAIETEALLTAEEVKEKNKGKIMIQSPTIDKLMECVVNFMA